MGYEDIIDFISTSNPHLDWKLIATRFSEEAFLKEDPRLRLSIRFDEHGIHEKKIKEPWVAKITDQAANSFWCELSYDNALLERCILVLTANGAEKIPMPVSYSNEIEPLCYKVAQIFDLSGNLDINLKKAGLTIK